MAKIFPNQEFNIRRHFALLLALTVSVATLGAQQSGSNETDFVPLKPYTAEYKTSARGMSITLERALSVDKDGAYTLTNSGNILIVGFSEESHFRVEGTRVIPESYVYQGKGLMNRRREVRFTPGADTLRSLYKDKWYDLPYTDNTLDRMSQQEQLRLLLLNDPTPREDVVITVADGKRVKDYRLAYVDEEIIDTPLGKINTLHFRRIHSKADRTSDTWIAPQWDYMMIKTIHIEDGKPVEGIIIKGSIDGVSLSAKH